jgi:hypothetical protein
VVSCQLLVVSWPFAFGLWSSDLRRIRPKIYPPKIKVERPKTEGQLTTDH